MVRDLCHLSVTVVKHYLWGDYGLVPLVLLIIGLRNGSISICFLSLVATYTVQFWKVTAITTVSLKNQFDFDYRLRKFPAGALREIDHSVIEQIIDQKHLQELASAEHIYSSKIYRRDWLEFSDNDPVAISPFRVFRVYTAGQTVWSGIKSFVNALDHH